MKLFSVSIYLFFLQLLIVDNTGLLFVRGRNNNNNKRVNQYNNYNNNHWNKQPSSSTTTKRTSLFLKSLRHNINSIPKKRYNHNVVRGGGGRLPKSSLSSTTTNDNISAKLLMKNDDDIMFLEKALSENIMFYNLLSTSGSSSSNIKEILMDTFECISVPENTILYQQGQSSWEDGGYIYVIAKGSTCTIQVDDKTIPAPYGTLTSGSVIGEQAILFNTTRTATVIANKKDNDNNDNNNNEVKLYRIRIAGTILQQILTEEESTKTVATPEELDRINDALQHVSGIKSLYGGTIIRPYENDRWWLWTKCWSGTVLKSNFKLVLVMMLYSLLVGKLCKSLPSLSPLLSSLNQIWSYQMSLTTFIVTFFLNQAFSFWREIYNLARVIQGQLSNFNLLLATNAKRDSTSGSYTREATAVLDDVSAFSRLFHCFMWAFHAKRFAILLTKGGLQTMACIGLLTSQQFEVLSTLEEQQPNTVPQSSKFVPLLEWMVIRAQKGCDEKHIRDPYGVTSKSLQEQVMALRGSALAISGKLKGRMPLAYTHMVQMLVDSFLLLSPWALYPKLGLGCTIACVGMLTFFYGGLLDLSKVFLDPCDNDELWALKGAVYMDLSVLIREGNAGSTIWKNSASILPFRV